ncbi:GIY-YIG nuclease family protein [Patescibacteria group bacterium]|nr:MAG: GIY-YIG nuclease family protein [Patescibacteria group bacterium]
MKDMSPWHVYIARCADLPAGRHGGSLYTGVTTDVPRRIAEHNAGIGAAYTRSRRPVALAWSEPAASRSAALKREARIKRMSREAKLALVVSSPHHSSRTRMAKGNHAQQRNKKKPKKNKKK